LNSSHACRELFSAMPKIRTDYRDCTLWQCVVTVSWFAAACYQLTT